MTLPRGWANRLAMNSFHSILLIGCGNMGGAMLDGWLAGGLDPARFTVVDPAARELPGGVAQFREIPPGAAFDAVLIGVKPQLLDADAGLGDPVPDNALVGERLAESDAGVCPRAHQLKCPLRDSDRAHAVVDPARSQARLRDREPVAFAADSNGCAAGNSLEEAIVQGFLELVERDAYAIWWYNRLRRPPLDLSLFDDPFVSDLQRRLTAADRKLWVLDVTGDLGIPTFVAITHWMQNGLENIEFGSGAHFDAKIALLRALTELNQFLSLGLMGGGTGEKSSLDGVTPLRLEDHAYLTPNGNPRVEPELGPKFCHLDTREQVNACIRVAKQAGLDFLVLDQTRPDIEVPVVRVIVPGLRHFYRRFAPGRLYDVPVKFGLRDRPLKENELNPIHPHS